MLKRSITHLPSKAIAEFIVRESLEANSANKANRRTQIVRLKNYFQHFGLPQVTLNL